MGAVASVIFKMYVFLREIEHLAAGAEWEPPQKTYMFWKECVHLVMRGCAFSFRGVRV